MHVNVFMSNYSQARSKVGVKMGFIPPNFNRTQNCLSLFGFLAPLLIRTPNFDAACASRYQTMQPILN